MEDSETYLENESSFDMHWVSFSFDEELSDVKRFYNKFCTSLSQESIFDNEESKATDRRQEITNIFESCKKQTQSLKKCDDLIKETNAIKKQVDVLRPEVQQIDECVQKLRKEYEQKSADMEIIIKRLSMAADFHKKYLDYSIKIKNGDEPNEFKAIVNFNGSKETSNNNEFEVAFLINSDSQQVIDLHFGSSLKSKEEEFKQLLKQEGYSRKILAEIRDIVLKERK